MNVIRPGETIKTPKKEEKEVALRSDNWYAEKAIEKNNLLDNIVVEWNNIVIPYSLAMIKFCNKLLELKRQFEHDSFSTIIREFSRHPNISHPPSPGRIWQYLMLIKNKPGIIKAMEFPNDKRNQGGYYYKNDGSIFIEFHIELSGGRHSLPAEVVRILEKRGIKERWSYRQLLDKIHEAREDTKLITGNVRLEKASLIRKIIARLRSLSVDQLKELWGKMKNVTGL